VRQIKRILREPLLHFLVLGAVLFAGYSALSDGEEERDDRIVISAGQIDHLKVGFTRAWRRPPTADEMNGLIRAHIREEVFYREAKAMGLDRNDTIIRRRLHQKLEFILQDVASQTEPPDRDLAGLLQSQPEKFRVGQRLSFSHVYFNPERYADGGREAAERLLTTLSTEGAKADVSAAGDRFMLGNRFDALPAAEAAKLFGPDFKKALVALQVGIWQGPIKSGYGLHLVLLTERDEGRIPTVAEARDALLREWKQAQRDKTNDDVFTKLLSRYTVTIKDTTPAAPEKTAWVRP
jgi:hypothetical protein